MRCRFPKVRLERRPGTITPTASGPLPAGGEGVEAIEEALGRGVAGADQVGDVLQLEAGGAVEAGAEVGEAAIDELDEVARQAPLGRRAPGVDQRHTTSG